MLIDNKIHWDVIIKYSLKNILFSLGVTTLAVMLHFIFEMDSWQVPIAIIATLGTALAIMLGFRNGSAYDRWWEARKIWGGVVNDSRTFTRQVLSMVRSEADPSSAAVIQQDLINTHLSFTHALRLQLRQISDENDWQKNVYGRLSDQTLKSVQNKSNRATQLLIELGKKLEYCRSNGLINDFEYMNMDNTLTRFSDYQGKSERIKNTPFPKAYEIFNRILLDLFVLFLPFALLPVLKEINGWWLVFPITVLISWVFFGIHRMGLHMANPFENFRWDVPLDAICNTIEIDLMEALGSQEIPEKATSKEGILM